MEVWLPAKDFPNYEVSSMGRVKNRKRDSLLTPHPSKHGYMHVGLYRDGERINQYVHRLVADTFYDGIHDGLDVNHIDGDKSNNFVGNLEWCTRSKNCSHAIRTGLKTPPSNHTARPIQVVETGEIFDSARKCVKAIHGERKSLHLCLKGLQKTHKGYHFRYADEEN